MGTHALPGTALVEKSWSVDCRGDPVICVERTHALPGTAVCREIVVAEGTLLFVWNACTHCQGPPCVEKSSSVDCRDDPVVYVERTHALPGTALCREIVVGRLQRRPCYLCGMHARIARDRLVQRNRRRSTAETTLLFVWNARTHCQGVPCAEKLLSVDCRGNPVICVERTHALPGTALCREIVVAEATLLFVWNARTQCQGPPCVEKSLSVDTYN